ncbi:hypothetical protein N7539_004680 [Penicillium diatomitis]|uniref:Uncharacterized protein n=1 Tax=Penicillium diatomitis TaxID=2819901 RepID=A0A9X0BYG8_9EURO|nr:uncharacterized protein N7539_004680 [Penicillium diatomitis]KAJ5489790.1 hypothetical protein N7539_004680 [Penicillium diatomitis]
MGRRAGDLPISPMGYDLPPHSVVSISYGDLHRNSKHWPEPQMAPRSSQRCSTARGLLFFCAPPGISAHNKPITNITSIDSLQVYYPLWAGRHSCIGKK